MGLVPLSSFRQNVLDNIAHRYDADLRNCPVDSPQDAVRNAIVAKFRAKKVLNIIPINRNPNCVKDSYNDQVDL